MAIIKCKMCGGDLNVAGDSQIAVCEYCGTQQTVPKQDNEKKLTLFARANRLRFACEFDKAAAYCARSFSVCSQTALFRTSSWLR